MRVTGGFFWRQGEHGVIECTPYELGSRVSECVIMERPHWWQLRQWWMAWRYVLSLPYARSSSSIAIAVRGTHADV